MKNYKKVYAKHFDIGQDDIALCEVCGAVGVDIHHIKLRSQGGEDNIENLILLCRSDHDKAHFKKEPYLSEEELQEIHNNFLTK